MQHFSVLSSALFRASFFFAAIVGVACSATNGNGFSSDPTSNHGGNGQGGDVGLGLTGAGNTTGTDGPLQVEPSCTVSDENADTDGDGFAIAQGDCNDCTAQMNPGAFDFVGNNIDEDCNGKLDDSTSCDQALSVTSQSGVDGAKAIGLCKMQSGKGWGLISALYVTADGSPLTNVDSQGLGHGILTGFGPTVHPQEGHRLLALSSGTARQPSDPGYQPVSGYDKWYETDAPPGFPKDSPSCPGVVTGEPHDSAALQVQVKVPTNVKSLSFNLDFYTYEYPNYICSEFNDFFVAILKPAPSGVEDGNISFDAMGNMISVNAGFLQVCTPQTAGGKTFTCPLGTGQLAGTGFDQDDFGFPTDNSAATGWLQTTAPVEGGSVVTLLFAVWDSGDGILDSTVLIDNFTWDAKGADTVTMPIVPK